MTMDYAQDRIKATQHILATIYAAQKALKTLAPEFKWAGLGNLLGDFGEAIDLGSKLISRGI